MKGVKVERLQKETGMENAGCGCVWLGQVDSGIVTYYLFHRYSRSCRIQRKSTFSRR